MKDGQYSLSTRAPNARAWIRELAPYRQPSRGRAATELLITALPLAGLWLLMWAVLDVSYWLALPLAIPAAGFLVRLFLIQHDCGHGSFVRSRRANDWIGRCIGVLTLTPYEYWRQSHAAHHASSGNLARRGIGDIDVLMVEEYCKLSLWGRLYYRLYRHPLVMFGIGPAYVFILQHRFPFGFKTREWASWSSTMMTNAVIALIAGGFVALIGLKAFLLLYLPVVLLAGSIGVWLFYVQHQFGDTTWKNHDEWDLPDAALHGSSHYDLPRVLRWFTANIGVHHVHHLCSRIPYYRLSRVLRDHPELRDIGRLTLWESLGCVRLALWDETRRRMVSFREARQRQFAAGQGVGDVQIRAFAQPQDAQG